MGRISKNKDRKPLSPNATLWVRELFFKLQDKHLDKLTLDEIALLTGKSKSTIYTYFKTKEEIFKTAVDLILNDLEKLVDNSLLNNNDSTSSSEDLYRSVLLNLSRGIEGVSIQFLNEIKQHFPFVWKAIEQFSIKILAIFENIYTKGMTSGEFNTFNVSLLKVLDTHFIFSIITDSNNFKNEKLSLNDLVVQYLELRIKALVSN